MLYEVITTAAKTGQALFVNARSDVYIRGPEFNTPESRLTEALKRGAAYKEAGADCFYPITLAEPEAIRKIVDTLRMPVNILLFPGVPALKSLKELGVARVSLGPALLKHTVRSMQDIVLKLKESYNFV